MSDISQCSGVAAGSADQTHCRGCGNPWPHACEAEHATLVECRAALAASQAERDALGRELADLQVTYSAKVMDIDAEHARELATLRRELAAATNRDALVSKLVAANAERDALKTDVERLTRQAEIDIAVGQAGTRLLAESNAERERLRVEVNTLNSQRETALAREREFRELHAQARATIAGLKGDLSAAQVDVFERDEHIGRIEAEAADARADIAVAAGSLERARGLLERWYDNYKNDGAAPIFDTTTFLLATPGTPTEEET